MRLWSISPSYLDSKGLVACWRESLLAQKVLLGLTQGYKQHPQLERFKQCTEPIEAIGHYLMEIYREAHKRGYNFDFSKIAFRGGLRHDDLTVTRGQLEFEFDHLLKKLTIRDKKQGAKNLISIAEPDDDIRLPIPIRANNIKVNPLFEVINGDIEPFERIK